MKIWHGFGTEHSMNLVMIGRFKNAVDADSTQKLIAELRDELREMIDIESSRERYGDDVLELLSRKGSFSLSPTELEQFLYDVDTKVDGDKIVLTTEEADISAFLKLMISNGAKVEIFSGHDYPRSKYGRGK